MDLLIQGTSTMYRILSDCSASVRQSVEGLDYYVAEGGQAFKDLEEVVQQLDLTLEEKHMTQQRLVAAKHYLKTDFKVCEIYSIIITPLPNEVVGAFWFHRDCLSVFRNACMRIENDLKFQIGRYKSRAHALTKSHVKSCR